MDENLKISISRLFADDTKGSAKIKTQEDTELLQQELNTIYKLADDNLMQFNEGKFEQLSHGEVKNVGRGMYKTKSGEMIEENKTIKDLGVLTSRDISFSEHIDDLVLSSKIKAGLLLRTFKTREAGPMMKMFNYLIRSKLDYCCLVWNLEKKEEIDKIERIQRNFTSRIRGLEGKNYHERLEILKLDSLERRREIFLIMKAWQQIEGKSENILKLETGKVGRF